MKVVPPMIIRESSKCLCVDVIETSMEPDVH